MEYLYCLWCGKYGYNWFNLGSNSRNKCPSICCVSCTSREDQEIEISPIVVPYRSTPPPFFVDGNCVDGNWLPTVIKDLLLSSINFALQYGRLSTEQRRGIISLLPKKDKDRLYLKNWRPISILNVDYKILARALGNRIISFLPTPIDEVQTGYIKKRFIGNNIRIIEDILLYTNKNKVTGILLIIDFEKAFDSLKWGFLKKCLQAFNFGQRFVSYINILYSDISAAVLNNEHISRWFYPEKRNQARVSVIAILIYSGSRNTFM